MEKTTVNVKNRGTATVVYSLDDSGVRRSFAPGEVKKNITIKELEELTYKAGGMKLLEKYLVINDQEVCDYLSIKTEPEYFYDENSILTLLKTGTLDQLLDCLDFAPTGVLDLVKKVALEIKINDVEKRDAIKKKLGFDITAALSNIEFANSADTEKDGGLASKRRATPITDSAQPQSGRRTTGLPVYNKVES